MKIKKALAYILAVAMVIAMIPSMAFAASDNSVKQVAKVAVDDTFRVTLNLKAKNDAVGNGSFDINLNGAEWADTTTVSAITTSAVNPEDSLTYAAVIAVTGSGITGAAVTSKSDDTARVELSGTCGVETYLRVALFLKATEEGDVTVTLTDNGALISGGTYTVATVGESGTVASVIGSTIKKVSSDGTYSGNTVKLSEVSNNSVENTKVQGIRLSLPKNYNWSLTDDDVYAMFSGDMLDKTVVATAEAITTPSAVTTSSTSAIYYKKGANDNVVDIYFVAEGDSTSTEILQITPKFTVDSSAATGDVTLTISNITGDISSADDLVIAQNVEESVEIKTIKEIPELTSGREYQAGKEDSNKLQYIYIVVKENVAGAITNDKSVKFQFPDEVQLANTNSIEVSTKKDATKDSTYGTDPVRASFTNLKDTYSKNANYITWKSASEADKTEYTFRIPVLVEAGYTGDIDVTVSGAKAGIEEQTVTVATVVNPIEVEATAAEIKTGIQNQSLGEIIIKESKKGMLLEGEDVTLEIKDLSATIKDSNAKIEVVEGDIDVQSLKADYNTVTFNIKSKSTKASTIKISGLALTTNRNPAEGAYDLLVKNDAVVTYLNAGIAPNDDNFNNYAAKVAGYVNIITPADSVTVSEKVDAKFVIGEASYTNNGAATEMDAAAYIDSHNRTMVPIRYVANACGISENDIRWEQNTQTAIINGLNTVVTVKMGSNKLQTSTGEITMDTVAVNNNGRIYVPVRYIANALGANVSWDAATKTVTLTK